MRVVFDLILYLGKNGYFLRIVKKILIVQEGFFIIFGVYIINLIIMILIG